MQTVMDKIKGDEGNKTAEFQENSDNDDSEEGCEKAGSSDSCCGLEVVEVERKPGVEISSDSECGTPRGRCEETVASLGALDMLLFPGAGAQTPKRQRFSQKLSPARHCWIRASPAKLPGPCALLDDTAMTTGQDCMAACAPTPRDYMKFAESKGTRRPSRSRVAKKRKTRRPHFRTKSLRRTRKS